MLPRCYGRLRQPATASEALVAGRLLLMAALAVVAPSLGSASRVCCETSTTYANGKRRCLNAPAGMNGYMWAKKCTNQGHTPRWHMRCAWCPDCCPVGHVCGDPHVSGFDGSSYLLYGKPNTTYSLISERNHQVNVHLYQPPSLGDGHALFIKAVGIAIYAARISVQLVPGQTASLVLTVNGGKPLGYPGHPIEQAVDERTSFAFESPVRVTITSSDITLSVKLMDNDHLDVGVEEVATNWHDVHGIMGQTYAAAFKIKYSYAKAEAVGVHPGRAARVKAVLQLQGTEDDYVVSSLFGSDDKYTRFCPRYVEGLPACNRLPPTTVLVASRKLQSIDAQGGGIAAQRVTTPAGVSMATDDSGTHKLAPQRRQLLLGPNLDNNIYCACTGGY